MSGDWWRLELPDVEFPRRSAVYADDALVWRPGVLLAAEELAYGLNKQPASALVSAGAWSYSRYLMHVPAMRIYGKLPVPNLGAGLNWCLAIGLILARLMFSTSLCGDRRAAWRAGWEPADLSLRSVFQNAFRNLVHSRVAGNRFGTFPSDICDTSARPCPSRRETLLPFAETAVASPPVGRTYEPLVPAKNA